MLHSYVCLRNLTLVLDILAAPDCLFEEGRAHIHIFNLKICQFHPNSNKMIFCPVHTFNHIPMGNMWDKILLNVNKH